MKRILLVLLSVVLVSLAPLSHAQEPGERSLYQQDFSGELPGWVLESGWAVTPDGTLPRVGHTWARFDGQDFGADWHLTFRLKLTRGRVLCRLPSSSREKRLVKQPTGRHGAVHSKQEFDVKSNPLVEARRQKEME